MDDLATPGHLYIMRGRLQLLVKAIGIMSALALCSAIVVGQHYNQTNLVSDIPNLAAKTDPNLVNPWGLARSSGGPHTGHSAQLFSRALCGNPQGLSIDARRRGVENQ